MAKVKTHVGDNLAAGKDEDILVVSVHLVRPAASSNQVLLFKMSVSLMLSNFEEV